MAEHIPTPEELALLADEVITMEGVPDPLDWTDDAVEPGTAVDALSGVLRSWRLTGTVAYVLICCHLFLAARAWLGLGDYVLTGETYRDVPGWTRGATLAMFALIVAWTIRSITLDGARYALGWAAVAASTYLVLTSAFFFPALVRNILTWILAPVVVFVMSRVLRAILEDEDFGPERVRQAWFASFVFLGLATVMIGAWLLGGPWGILGHAWAAYSYLHLGGSFVDLVSFLLRLFIAPLVLYFVWEWVYTKASRF